MAKTTSMTPYEAAQITAKHESLATSLRREQLESVISVLGRIQDAHYDIGEKLGETTAKYKSKAQSDILAIERAVRSGSDAARIRGLVDLHELVVSSPIDFARAAHLPNTATLDAVRLAIPQNVMATNPAEAKRIAWQTFYSKIEPNAGNLQGTYDQMVDDYGEDKDYVKEEDTFLWNKKQLVENKLTTERAAAQDFDTRIRAIADSGTTYQKWAADNGLNPDDDATRKRFVQDMGLDKLIPMTGDSPFVTKLKATVLDPNAYKDELYRSDFARELKRNEADQEFWKSMLPGDLDGTGASGETSADDEWTRRDKLAAWVGRPETQEWAKKNGFTLGRTVPLTPELQKEIDDGVYPGSVYAHGQVYIPSPDDWKAFREFRGQLQRRPERQVGRALGLRHGSSSVVEFDYLPAKVLDAAKQARGPRLVESTMDYSGGALGKLEDGSYVVGTLDGNNLVWKPLPADQAQAAIAAEKLSLAPQEKDIEVFPLAKTTELPKPKRVTGVYRPPMAGDPSGSLRFVDPQTGEEHYIAPQDIEAWHFPAGEPGHKKPQPLDDVRRAQAQRVLRKMLAPPLPTGPAPAAAPAQAAPPLPTPPVPPLAKTDVMPPAPGSQPPPVPPRVAADVAPPPIPKPEGPPPVPKSSGTTTTPTVAPTKGANERDVLRQQFKRARMSPMGTAYAPPPE